MIQTGINFSTIIFNFKTDENPNELDIFHYEDKTIICMSSDGLSWRVYTNDPLEFIPYKYLSKERTKSPKKK